MAQFDFKQYQGALLAFLTYLDALQEPKSLIAEYLRFPEHDHSTLSSSKLGADMWREPTAKALVDELLKDKDLSEWFAPKSGPTPGLRLNELHSHIASLVAAWHEAPGAPEEIVRSWSDALLQDLKNPDPACNRIRILYGVSLAGRVELSSGTVIEPASVEGLRRFLQGTGGTERDVLRLPKRPAIFVSTGTKAKRNEYGAFAATTPHAWSDVVAENARRDLCLGTWALPRLGDGRLGGPLPLTTSSLPFRQHPSGGGLPPNARLILKRRITSQLSWSQSGSLRSRSSWKQSAAGSLRFRKNQ